MCLIRLKMGNRNWGESKYIEFYEKQKVDLANCPKQKNRK
jgi:hypothetical protein